VFQSLMLLHRVLRRFRAYVISWMMPAQYRIVQAVQRRIRSRPAV
jgi:hypothetical protein